MDAYASWALFLIFVSILILISGVVLLTHKKPDEHAVHHVNTPRSAPGAMTLSSESPRANRGRSRRRSKGLKTKKLGDEEHGLGDDDDEHSGSEVLWQVGDVSDDEGEDYVEEGDEDHELPVRVRREPGHGVDGGKGERERMISCHDHHDEEGDDHRESTSSDATLARPDAEGSGPGDSDEFGDWEGAKPRR